MSEAHWGQVLVRNRCRAENRLHITHPNVDDGPASDFIGRSTDEIPQTSDQKLETATKATINAKNLTLGRNRRYSRGEQS